MKTLRLLALLLCSLAPLLHAQTGLTRLGEFKVNSTTSGDQGEPSIATDGNGNFVVVWRSVGTGNGATDGILAQRYNRAGSPVGAQIPIETDSRVQLAFTKPVVACASNGSFAVVFDVDGVGIDTAIKRFDANGTALAAYDIANFSRTSDDEKFPDIAMAPSGRAVVVWDGDSLGRSPQYQVFGANGAAEGTHRSVYDPATEPSRTKIEGTVAMDSDGSFIIAWRDMVDGGGDIFARRFLADGTPNGDVFQVNPADGTQIRKQELPSVAIAADGTFVIAWNDEYDATNNFNDVVLQRFTADAQKIGSAAVVESSNAGKQRNPCVSIDASGRINVVFNTDAYGTGVAFECAVRRFLPDPVQGVVPQGTEERVNLLSPTDQVIPVSQKAVTADQDGNLFVVFQTEAYGSGADVGGELLFLPNQGPPLTEFRVNTATAGNQSSPSVASAPDGRFVVVWRGFDAVGAAAIRGQRFDASGRKFGPEFNVNTLQLPANYFGDLHHTFLAPDVAMDSAGNFVVVYVRDSDGNGKGVTGRRFSWDPQTAPSAEFPVNTQNIYDQVSPSVAVAPDGRFAVVWLTFNPATDIRSYVQFFSAAGTSVGGQVELTPSNISLDATIAASPLNRFVVVWRQSPDGNNSNVLLRTFDFDGVADGGPVPVEGDGNGQQQQPAVAFAPDGSMLIVWETVNGDGNGFGITALKADGAGNPVGSIVPVNTATAGDQQNASVAFASGSRFAVVYRSPSLAGLDSSAGAVALQLLDAAPTSPSKVGGESVVNLFTAGEQRPTPFKKAIASDAVGNYVVVWHSENQDGSDYGVYATKVFVSTPPVVTTGEATDKTASTATLNGTVTPNDVAVDVSFEYGAAADALTNSVTAKLANDAPATGLTGAVAIDVLADVAANLAPNVDGSAKTYFFRAKATGAGGTTFPGDMVQFTIANSAPMPKADAAFFTSGSIAVPVGGLAVDADGDALTIVGTPAQAAGEILLGTVSPAQDGKSFTFKPNAQFPNAQDGVTLNYMVSDGRTVPGPVAGSVKIYSFSLFSGAYVGTIKTDEGGVDGTGRLGLNIMVTGTISYSFTWQGRDYSGKSQIGPDGALPPLSEFKVGDGGPTLSLSLNLQPDPVSRLLDGTLTDGEDGKVATARLLGTVRASDDGADLPEPGTFTGYIEPLVVTSAVAEGAPEAGLTLLPRGTGFTRFTTLNRRGRPARIVGRLPDDQPWSNGVKGVTRSQRDAGNPFYQILNDILYGRVTNGSRGVVEGQARFQRNANFNGFESRLNWERAAGVGDRFAQGFRTVRPGLAGFIATLEAIKYNRPFPFPAGIVDNTNTVNAQIDFREGGLDSDLARDLKLRRTGRGPIRVQVGPGEPAGKQPKDLKLKVNVNAGTFSGSFVHPKHEALAKPPRTTFSGVFTTPAVSADPGDGQGVFNGPDADSTTGSITIQGK